MEKKLHVLCRRAVPAQNDQCRRNPLYSQKNSFVSPANVVCEGNVIVLAENPLSLDKCYVIMPAEFFKYSRAKKLAQAWTEKPQAVSEQSFVVGVCSKQTLSYCFLRDEFQSLCLMIDITVTLLQFIVFIL